MDNHAAPLSDWSKAYALLDWGGGRKLERFGDQIVIRPSPAADFIPERDPHRWEALTLEYERLSQQQGTWSAHRQQTLPFTWQIGWQTLQFELQTTPSGQIGIFPEQADNWRWLTEHLTRYRTQNPTAPPLQLLNLFAYTGASTLAAAAAGAAVTHVDGVKGIVSWARRNAAASNLATAPIRWLVEEVQTFVRREIRRGKLYDGVILDPPTYGHGPWGGAWQIDRHLPGLFSQCRALCGPRPKLVLLSAHSAGWDGSALRQLIHKSFEGLTDDPFEFGPLDLPCRGNKPLPSGDFARVSTIAL